MKKVLHITSSLSRNGTETFIMNVLRNIDRTKVTFDFLLYNHVEDGYEEEATAYGSKIYFYTQRRYGFRKYYLSLKRFFRDHGNEYSAVHFSGNSFTEILPVIMAKRAGIPIRILHSHNSSVSGWHNKLFHNLNKRRLHRFATHFLACSNSARDWGYKGTKIFQKSMVIPNGIDLSLYKFNLSDRREIRKELGIDAGAFIISHTGTFRPVKNHPFLLEVFAEIKKKRPDAYLLLCGAGGNEESMRNFVNENGLSGSVKFLGIRKDVNKILSAADAYVFPSLYEGLPFALIEAQANGIMIFASDSISPEIKLTDKLFFLNLGVSPEKWAHEILKRKYIEERLSGEGKNLDRYDIRHTCSILTDIYLGSDIPRTVSIT